MDKLTPRQIQNRIKKELVIIEQHKNQKPVESLSIVIEWKKSRMWGMNPHATAEVHFKDGTFQRKEGYTCGGCGYDKTSTVVADIFNEFLRYKLYEKHEWKLTVHEANYPYGVDYFDGGTVAPERHGHQWYFKKPSFNGGVGISCYPAIGKFIGGTFETIAGGKTFDVFKYTDGGK